ncbi:uncharacterized protein LOC142786767 [Rhipicephalus microplus]|uniref:uncharacterized protein LOC142786767 n=1 Tax=Rhipicephalus microplus TaxID=6941 RepID=UPI003F6C67B4
MKWQDRGRKDSMVRWLLLCASCLAVQLACSVLPTARALDAGSSTGGTGSSSEVYLSSVERESDSPATSDVPATSAETPGGGDPSVPAPRLAFLDKMLEQYDKRAWPTYGMGHPTYVKVNIYVNSIGPVNANNMEPHLQWAIKVKKHVGEHECRAHL